MKNFIATEIRRIMKDKSNRIYLPQEIVSHHFYKKKKKKKLISASGQDDDRHKYTITDIIKSTDY